MSEEVLSPLDPKSTFKNDVADMISAISNNEIKQIYGLLVQYKNNNISDSDIFKILYQSYHETIIKNILLTNKVKLFVETELVDIYYRCFDANYDYPKNLSWIREKIRFIRTAVNQLKNHEGAINQTFMYVMTVLVKDIYLLKRLMKSTYDRIPWEEIEFCLTVFLLAHKSVNEINFYYHSYIKRDRIMRHLGIFLDCLNKVDNTLNEKTDISKLSCLPKKQRTDIVKQICRECTEITDLYEDFHKLRDICSLNEIEKYLNLVRSCDVSQMKGRLTIIRSLQVMGEHMKNTLGSPKMSPFNVDLLQSRMTTNTKQMITNIRDKISHSSITEMKRELYDNDLFLAIKGDLENTSDTIRQILKYSKVEAIQNFTKRFKNLEDLMTVAEDIELLYYVDHEKAILFNSTYNKLEEIVEDLKPNPIFDANELHNSPDSLFDIARVQLKSIHLPNKLLSIVRQRFLSNLKVLKEIKGKDQLLVKIIKKEATSLPKDIDINYCDPLFNTMMTAIMESIYSSDQNQDESKLAELVTIAESFFTYNRNTSIEKLWMLWKGFLKDNMPDNNEVDEAQSETSESSGDTIWKFLEDDLTKQFKNIKNGVEVLINQEQLALTELYIQDQLPCLEMANDSQHNFEPFDNIPLLLTGTRLRNHLAHHNFLNYIFIPDITIALVTNAIALCRKYPVNSERDVATSELLLIDHKADLEMICLQNRLFDDLMKADLDDLVKNSYSNSDFRGRDAQGKGSLHYAAMAQQVDSVKLLLERNDLNLNINAQDIYLKTPLHISAWFGRPDVTEYLLDHSADVKIKDRNGFQAIHYAVANDFFETTKALFKKSDVSDNCTSNGNTALHIAAKFDSPVVAKYLMANSDDLSKENLEGFTPLHNAVFYGNINLIKTLVEKVNLNREEADRILCIAVSTGSEEIVKYLLENGVLVNKSFMWTTPLLEAAHFGNEKIVSILLEHNVDVNAVELDGLTSLHNILCNNNNSVDTTLGIVGGLIKVGCSVNARSVRGYTPLYFSLVQSNYVVELLLECGADVNAQTNDGNTSLHRAASLGEPDKIKLLLKYSGDLNIVNNEGFTPLHFAAVNDNLDVFEQLIENGLNIHSKNKFGNEPLHFAASFGCKLITEFILNKNNNANIDVTNNANLTPLHFAVMRGNLEYIKFLISKGANVNLKDSEGLTPLHLAVRKEYSSVVKLLLDNEADINALDDTLISSLTLAIKFNMMSIVQLLLKRGSKIDMFAVNSAMKTSRFMIKKVILDHKETLSLNIQGFSLIHCASRNGPPELVNQLLLNGADVNSVDANYFTPLHHATHRGDKNIIKILLSHGAEPNYKGNNNNNTPLEIAILLGQTELVEVFLENRNINLNCLDEKGKALLHLAVFTGHKDIAQLLISKGADINLTDKYHNQKPVYLATFLGKSEFVILFLNKKCEIENMRGNTLLHFAAYFGHTQLINVLIGMKFDMNVKSEEGFTPLHYAARCKHKEAVLTLLNHGAQLVGISEFSSTGIQNIPEIAKIIEASDALYENVKKNYLEGTRKCIKDGAVTNTTASPGETSLHYAVTNNFIYIINILLENHSNPNIKNKIGETALHLASKLNNRDVVKILLANGAQFDSLSSAGQTPLDLTNDEVITKVLQDVIDVFEMVERNETEVIERVKETIMNNPSMKNILINTRNKENKTLLEVVYKSDFLKSQDIKMLLDENLYNITSLAKAMVIRGEIYEALTIINNFKLQYKTLNNIILWDLQLLKAYILCHSLQIDSCRTLLNRIYKEQEEILGPEHNLTLLTSMQIAKFSSFIGENDQALKILRNICQLFKKSDDKRTDLLTGVKFNIYYQCTSLIGNSLCLLRKCEKALAFSEDGFFNLSRERGANDERTLEAQVIYASNLLSLNRYDEALALYTDARDKQLKLYDKTSPVVLSTTNLILTTICFMDKYHGTVKELKEVLKVQKILLPGCHPDILSTQNSLAYAYFLKKLFLNAYGLSKLTYDKGKIIFGKSHPQILSAQEVLYTLNYHNVDLKTIFQSLQKDLKLAIINGDVEMKRFMLNGL